MGTEYLEKRVKFLKRIEDNLPRVLEVIREDRIKDQVLFSTYLKLRKMGLWGADEYDFGILTDLLEIAQNSKGKINNGKN